MGTREGNAGTCVPGATISGQYYLSVVLGSVLCFWTEGVWNLYLSLMLTGSSSSKDQCSEGSEVSEKSKEKPISV